MYYSVKQPILTFIVRPCIVCCYQLVYVYADVLALFLKDNVLCYYRKFSEFYFKLGHYWGV